MEMCAYCDKKFAEGGKNHFKDESRIEYEQVQNKLRISLVRLHAKWMQLELKRRLFSADLLTANLFVN